MEVAYENSFLRDLKKIKDRAIKKKIEQLIAIIKASASPQAIPGLKKLKGTQHYYRIRMGDYRLGLKITGDKVILVRIL